MTRVKICGITSAADAELAVDLGASAIGLIFWPSSPRFVEQSRAREIVTRLPPFVSVVGVFVNQVKEAARVAADLGLSAVQFHGDEPVDDYREFPAPVIKSIGVRDGSARQDAAAVPSHVTVLLDAHDPLKRGGTGTIIDWSVAAGIARERSVILSGGLNASNVEAAVSAVRPYAIDVSSGVESAPGKKDPEKMRALFAALQTI